MQRPLEHSALGKGMSDLKQRVSEIANLIPRNAPVIYCDFPIHNNFGDVLIMLGTAAFLEQLENSVVDSFTIHAPQKIRFARPQGTVWLLHGGGNFGDLWSKHQNFREEIILAHPSDRIISLPQTMHYSSNIQLKRFAEIAARHTDLHLFWRDHLSFDTAQRYFDCHNYLCPDMAHYLWPVVGYRPIAASRRDLFLIRRDKERGAVPGWVLEHRDEFVDWRELTPAHYRLIRRPVRFLDVAGGVTGMRSPALKCWLWGMRRLLPVMSGTFRRYDRIVTSRLHAHIFACLVGSRSVLIDNFYGKNRTYFDAWTGGLGIAEFAAAEANGLNTCVGTTVS